MKRALLGLYTYFEFFFFGVVFLVPMGFATLLHFREPGRRVRGRWMRRFGWFTSQLTPLWNFSTEGKAPADIGSKGYVVVANHESTSDPFLLTYLPFDMRFIAKQELFKLPIIGQLMQLSGDIPLRRGDKGSIVAMHEECLATLKAGVSIMMFPEGTRSPDGNLLPFKDGAFRLAIEAQVPVLPVPLAGTRDCRPKGSLWFGHANARVRMLEPIPTAGMTLDDLPKLRELTRERIQSAVEEMRRELKSARVPDAAPALGAPSRAA